MTLSWTYTNYDDNPAVPGRCPGTNLHTSTSLTIPMNYVAGYGWMSGTTAVSHHSWCVLVNSCGSAVGGPIADGFLIRFGIFCSTSPTRLYYQFFSVGSPPGPTACRPGERFNAFTAADCGAFAVSNCRYIEMGVVSSSPLHLHASLDNAGNTDTYNDTLDVTS